MILKHLGPFLSFKPNTNININKRHGGRTPLHILADSFTLKKSSAKNILEKAKLLIQQGADVNAITKGGNTALLLACGDMKNPELINFLLDHKAAINFKHTVSGTNAFYSAIRSIDYDSKTIKRLVDLGSELDQYSVTFIFNHPDKQLSKYILAKYKTIDSKIISKLLFESIANNDIDKVKLALNYGADITAKFSASSIPKLRTQYRSRLYKLFY